MNNTAPHLCLITEDHIDAIASYYPNFDLNHISNVTISNGIIKFKYENSTYVCNYREKKKEDSVPKVPVDIFQVQTDMMNGFLSAMWAHHDRQKNVNFIFLEYMEHIITEYFFNIDLTKVEDVHVSWGHILFKYFKSIYMCPIKHMAEFKYGTSLKEEVVKISDIILQYFPKMEIQYIRDTIIDSGMIAFKYLSETYSCPLKPPTQLQQEYHEIRAAEVSLHEQESVKKAVLRVVK